MGTYVTVDGGTTNTRLSLVADGAVVDTVRYSIGAGCGDDPSELIGRAVAEGVEALSTKNHIGRCEIECIILSGMITSERGLQPIPHLVAPVGLDELADGIFETRIAACADIPAAFIRGVRINSTDIAELDMMRGEETEIMGIGELPTRTLYIFPGSHTKHILTDSEGRIAASRTTLTGELISAVARDTILKNSVSLGACQIKCDFLEFGYEISQKLGFAAALFKVRVLDKLVGADEDEVYSFYLGAALECDVALARDALADRITVGGKRELRDPMAHLLRKYSDKPVIELSDDEAARATAFGAIKIYERRKNKNNGEAL
jgi:2-dehydro-3-deoxygalactonokinase